MFKMLSQKSLDLEFRVDKALLFGVFTMMRMRSLQLRPVPDMGPPILVAD